MKSPFQPTRLTTQINNEPFIIETGRLANQAHGSTWVQCGDTVVLVTAVTQPSDRELDFMPMIVEYQEMSYASGNIPGSYFRREIGRPSERETLVSRLIDRPIRPLFPEGFRQEVQIMATVLSADPKHDPDVLAITGASTAMHLSKIPFNGPIAGARIGYVDNEFVLNPSQAELEFSQINLILAATEDAVVMVEGGADFASEELMAEAIAWGHEQIQPLIKMQHELRSQVGADKLPVAEPEPDSELEAAVREFSAPKLESALSIPTKAERTEAVKAVKEDLMTAMAERYPEEPDRLKKASGLLKELESELVRKKIKDTGTRIDGRDMKTVRDLGIEVGVLPRVHGSSIFGRGETKVLGTVTLGGTQDEQHVETLSGEVSKRFMLHYNFPPYCVGEVKMPRGPSRREIGHGALAERALSPVLPFAEDFPFTVRIVAEVMESNGSSSMATVCAGSLALMDAGVPVSSQVAGIAMGLIQDGEEFYILTDILGDEDHLGDMDFKVAGSKDGITAIQMDIKISGITSEVLKKALHQARDARMHILDNMDNVLSRPRTDLSEHAPQLKVIEVHPDRIKDVIGPGGKNIRAITKATGASIDIEDSGKISIFAPDQSTLQETIDMVMFYDQKAELGKTYDGKVKSIKDFGAFVEILPGVEGMVHISQIDTERVENIHDYLKLGDELRVKVIEIEENTGKIRLSRKAVLLEEQGKPFTMPSGRGPGGGGGKKPGGGPRNKDSRGPRSSPKNKDS
ncbi:polyribonucleotide nucleotidyltransferase [Desulfovermiculus halophilus]|uniref:polyribonucleotide nucleotidyltransferase n=1 Tax=Desulfovermiculus halophilus TaxID=339722 RepID=UPI00047F09CC|nr:polyribonucleotide nucleotidyltransferase [Desulfovermiculus halophilus]